MCGRFANQVERLQSWAEFLSDWPLDATTGYNIAPTQNIPVFTGEGGKAMRWGLVPAWSKEATPKYATFNARTEGIAEKPAYRSAWNQSQTCIVPALGYYEWTGSEWTGSKGSTQPHFITTHNGEPLMMAGLWDRWGAAEKPLLSCTILTEASFGGLERLHHRKPIWLELEQARRWLYDGVDAFSDLRQQQNIGNIDYYAVSHSVNKASNAGAELIQRI